MKWTDLKIGTRLNAGFGLLIAMMLGMAVVGVVRFAQVGEVNTRIIEKDWVKSEAASTINATTRANGRRTMELVLATDPAQISAVKAAIEVNKKTISDALKTLEQLVYLPEGRALVAQLIDARKKYVASFSKVAQLMNDGKKDEAITVLNTETMPALDALQAPINALTALQKRIVEASSAEAQSPHGGWR